VLCVVGIVSLFRKADADRTPPAMTA